MASTVRTDKVGPVSGSADFILPTADGTVGQFLKTDGSLALGFATVTSTVYGLNSVQVFTSGGTWTKPTGITKVIVEVQGAGGSGANRSSSGHYAVSGAGGGYAKKFLDVSNTTSATVTIGSGGPAQTTGNTGGTAGGLSKFEENVGSGGWADVIGNGGAAGGEAVAYATSTGGTGSGGDFNIQGQYGTAGGASDRSGSSVLGFGNKMVQTGQTTVVPSTGYGAGGGGSLGVNSTAGTGGIVIVTEYK